MFSDRVKIFSLLSVKNIFFITIRVKEFFIANIYIYPHFEVFIHKTTQYFRQRMSAVEIFKLTESF